MRCKKTLIFYLQIFFSVLLTVSLFVFDASASESTSATATTQSIFQTLQNSANAINAGDARGAGMAITGNLCREWVGGSLQQQFTSGLSDSVLNQSLGGKLGIMLSNKLAQGASRAEDAACAALAGQELAPVDSSGAIGDLLRQDLAPLMLTSGQSLAKEHDIPFLSQLEVGLGSEAGKFISYLSSVQPLWHDELHKHHVFMQASYYTVGGDSDTQDSQQLHDTMNLGLAYRHLTDDKKYLYGANVFFDHAPDANHNRMSVGVDARTSAASLAVNKYFPISDWKKVDNYYEEKAAGGFDIKVSGQFPQLPSWTGSLTGYQWDDKDSEGNLYGTVAALEYSPVPALALQLGVRDENQSNPSLEAGLKFAYKFDQPSDLQWKERTQLAPVSDFVYAKVERQNLIRTKQQRRAESKLVVIETNGANTASEASGSSALSLNQVLLMPVTVTVANTAGAIARLRLSDGSLLTAGQNTQVLIEPTLVTLVYGSIQYTSNSLIQTVVVPGGTIQLHGTDIDVTGSGTSSTVRVRDGSVDFIGTASGSATLTPGQGARSTAGVVASIASNSAAYITHTDTISALIDRVASAVSGSNVTPYPYEAPRVVSNNMTVGGTIVLGLKFNAPVTVTGGTPNLTFTINSVQRTATYISGSGTNDLQFSYTNVLADISATQITVTGFDLNGSTVSGNGKTAVTTIADVTLAVDGTGDVTAPTGYAGVWVTDPVNSSNASAAAFNITSGEVASSYSYSISSSGGGTPVTGTGTIAAATTNFTSLNLSGLGDGTLTVTITLTDTSGNTGGAATATVTKDTLAPTVSSVSSPTSGTYEP